MATRGRKKPPTPPPVVQPTAVVQEVVEPEKPKLHPGLYGRVVIVLPYDAAEEVARIQSIQERISCEKLKLGTISRSALASRSFKPDEMSDANFDILTGFVLIDSEVRLYVIEGLAEGCIKTLISELPRQKSNETTFKYLMNIEVKFDQRLYLEFGADLKRIKLREPLQKILLNPDIYIKAKVSEELMETLNKSMELRRADRLKFVRDFNICPTVSNLYLLERKYGDALTDMDIYGKSSKVKKVEFKETASLSPKAKSPEKSKEMGSKRNRVKVKDDLDMDNPAFLARLEERKAGGVKDFKVSNKEKVRETSDINAITRPKDYLKPEHETGEVFIYSGQKLNYTEHMKWKLANEFLQDPKHFYTLSPDYLTLSWPLVDEDKLKAEEREKFSGTRLKYK